MGRRVDVWEDGWVGLWVPKIVPKVRPPLTPKYSTCGNDAPNVHSRRDLDNVQFKSILHLGYVPTQIP